MKNILQLIIVLSALFIAPKNAVSQCAGTYTVTISPCGWWDEGYFQIRNASNDVVYSSGGGGTFNYVTDGIAPNNGPFTFFISTVGWWNDNCANYTVTSGGVTYVSGTITGGQNITSSSFCGFSPVLESQTNVACNGNSTGALDISVSGGSGPYTYLWSNGATTQDISGLIAGDYSVTITDFLGATCSGTYTITQPAPITLNLTSITNVSCWGESTGSIDISTVTCNTPVTYTWSNGATTEDLINVPAGTYSLTAVDNLGNTISSGPHTITQPPAINLSLNAIVNASCFGSNDGSIDISSSACNAPLTYLWSNGATTEDLSGVIAGSYTVTLTDGLSNTSSATYVVTEPSFSYTIAVTDPSCGAPNSGAIDLTITSSTLSVSSIDYYWLATTCSGPQNLSFSINGTNTYTGMADPGTCSCTPGINSVNISNPVALAAIVNGANDFVADFTGVDYQSWTKAILNFSDGSTQEIVIFDVYGGAPGFDGNLCNGYYSYGYYNVNAAVNSSIPPTYAWSNGATTEDISSLTGGTYNVDVTVGSCVYNLPPVTLTSTGAGVLTVTCPTDITVNNVPNNCGRVVNYSVPLESSSCSGNVTITQTDASGLTAGDLFPVGTTYQEYTYSEVGSTIVCGFNVIVNDVQNPTITPLSFSDILVNNTPGMCGANVSWLEPTASDNCPGVILTSTSIMGSYFPLGTTLVTYTATDASGLTSSLSFNVTVVDNIAPEAICQDVNVYLDVTGNGSTTAVLVNNGSTDECGIASMVLSQTAFTCANVGSNPVTLTVTDNNGNVSTCNATVTVIDAIAPVATCQDITIQLNASGNATITASQIDNGSSDICGVTLSADITTFDCSNVGSNIVTLTVTDASGNSSTCTSTVTVEDNEAPIALCQDIIIGLVDPLGEAYITGIGLDNGSNDACGIASYTSSVSTFTCADVGINPITLTVIDNNGNSSTCVSNVNVVDYSIPTVICQNITVPLDVTGNVTILATDIDGGSIDPCGIASYVASQTTFNCSNVGSNPVTLTVTDNNGNSASCVSTVTIIDNIAPVAICQDLIVQLDATGNVTITASQIDNGSNDACGVTLSASQTTFNCSNVGVNTVTLTVTDASGNSSTCTSTVTVQDNVLPIAICQDIIIGLVDPLGEAYITGIGLDNGSSDACGIASYTSSVSTFTCANVGINPVTLTVIDNNGNSSTCISNVNVVDFSPPTVICKNVTVYLDGTGNISIVANDIDNGSSDPCGIATMVASQTAFNCSNIGPNNVTLTVTDVNGNSASCTAIVTVLETTPPVAVCQDISINLNAAGTATITAAMINNGSSDNCGIVSYVASKTSFNCSNIGVNNVTLTVMDGSGNSSTCNALVTVNDMIAPTAICQNISVNLNAAGTASITASMLNNGSSDNCTIASMVASQTNFTCANVGPNNVTLTVTDQSGNSSTCTAIVTVVDNIAPTAICKNYTANLDASGNATILASDINNGSYDNCGIATMTVSPSNFTCANVGTPVTVTLTVTDVNGLVSTCSSIVTVLDVTPPTAICQNISVNLNASGSATITAAMINNGSTDNCGIATITASKTLFACSDVGPNNVILTVTDVNGNSSTCIAVVTVVDTVAPNAICKNITVNLNAAGTATVTGAMINNGSSDACGISSLVANPSSFTCANVGPNTVTLTVTDVNGNVSTCTSTVTIVDNIAPTAICQPVTINLDAAGTASVTSAMVNNGSFDNCGIATMTVSPSNFTCSNVGPNTVTLTVTDVNGLISTCTSTVTVVDNIAPTAICQNRTVNLNAAGTASITAAFINNGSFDNCGIATMTVSPSTFNCSNVGPNTVTLTVTDVNGNVSTCTSTVTIVDNIAPTAICQSATVNLNAAGTASVTVANINNGSFDNCGIASMTIAPSNFTCANVGPNTVTLTVTDVNGLVSTCTSTVTVVDNIAPSAICQNISVNLDATGNTTITASMIDGGSTDNCGIASLSASNTNFTCANVGSNSVTLTVTDVNGNSSSCNAIVTIVDNTAPVAICQNQTIDLDIFGNASITAGMINNGSSDACGIATIFASQTAFNCSNIGPNSVTLTVTDVNGNSSTCSSIVTVQDLISPIVNTQDITVALDASGNATITGPMITASVFDNCGIASSVPSQTNFNCTNLGPNNVTLTVTDPSGNTATGTAVVTIIDNMAPVAICQNITINLSAAGTASITPAMINNGSTDNCGIASITASQLNFTCGNVGNNNVTLTVSDVNGNSSSCLAVVTVVDNINPVAVCQNVTLNLNSNGDALLTPSMVDNGSTDNCAIAFMSVSQANFNCSNIGTNNITFTVTDQSGLTSTCVSVITIIDNISPNAICQNITVTLDSTGSATITPSMINNNSTDNCGVASLSASQTTFTCANVGSNNVVLTVTDPSGNSSTCTAVVTVVDNIAPTAICQAVTVNLNSAGTASITAGMINNGSFDNCGVASVSVSPSNFTCSNVGPNTVTLTVTDVNGNVSTCTSIVTVVDNIAPTAICQNVSISLNASGNASITAGMINNGSFDNCGISSISASQTTFNCSDLGANNVTLSVTDVNGNVGTCIAVVTVIDGINPVITCPSNITVNSTPGICGAAVTLVAPIASDNCSVTITNNGLAIYPVGTTTVIWTATDPAGNAVSCSQTVTVIDNESPTMICLSDVIVNTNPNICFATGVNLGTPITSDNCSVASVTNNGPSFYPLGNTIVTWTVTDGSGNTTTCTQTVTVIDNQPPAVNCTSNIVLSTVPGSCGRVVTYQVPTVIDNCSVLSMTQTDNSGLTSGNVFPVGVTTLTYTAVDGSGNTYSCSFTVTIQDNQFPTINGCPSDITVYSSVGSCDVNVNWVSPTANDNCPGVQLTTTHASGSLFGPGTTVVTYQAIDNAGNITVCNFNVTVIDGNAPVVPELADVYNSCQVVSLPSPVANDYCAGEIIGTTSTVFPITYVGITPVTWSFNDGNGNTSTAIQYVYIDGVVDVTVTIVDQVTLMANNNNATYQWINCETGANIPGATNQTFVATSNGSFAVVVTENGCPSTTSDCILVKTVGLENLTTNELIIYPNPSLGGVFTISYDGKIDKIEIVDMIGRIIAIDTNLDNGTVNGSSLATGKYFVRVYTEGQVIAKEVIVITK